jgi:uncharacterized membrane protein YcaP (DUF421 family)
LPSILHLTIELIFGFIALLLAVKIIGRRHVQQISPFDFISAIVMGELLGNAIYSDETTIFYIIYAIAVWALLLYIIEKLTQKSHKFRNVIEGSPILIIKKGMIDFNVLKKEKLDFTELLSLLRNKGIFSVREVEYAIVEPSGIITVIKKAPYDSVNKSDLGLQPPPSSINLPVVLDGKIDFNNLKVLGFDEEWLSQRLLEQNITSVSNVMYAEWTPSEGLYVQQRNDPLPQNAR